MMQLLYLFIVRRSKPSVGEVFTGSVTDRMCTNIVLFHNASDDVVCPFGHTYLYYYNTSYSLPWPITPIYICIIYMYSRYYVLSSLRKTGFRQIVRTRMERMIRNRKRLCATTSEVSRLWTTFVFQLEQRLCCRYSENGRHSINRKKTKTFQGLVECV